MNFKSNNKSILLTGGTGSFGKAFTDKLVKKNNFKKLVILSRDELKQSEMEHKYKNNKKLRFFLGDIRDKERLERALEGIDIVVHAAALKQVPKAEYDPSEFIKTNILGTQNLIDASLKNKVENFLTLSTDKAVSPINLYGATKLCAEKLTISANNIKGQRKIKFSVLRYGNVFGSRGSVVPNFIKLITEKKPLTITDPNMTRFSLTLNDSVDLVFKILDINKGGEIFIPKIPSYKILDLAKSFSPEKGMKIIGIRPGEKIYEELISEKEVLNTFYHKGFFVISDKKINSNKLIKLNMKQGYNSKDNNFLTVKQIKSLIKHYKKLN